jgi:hypothetical protein
MTSENSFIVARDTKSGNWLVTLAIGDEYFSTWTSTVKNSWLDYADRYDLGVLIITEHLIEADNPNWKKPTWQKLLIASNLKYLDREVKLLCYLDTDILVNPFSPNVFDLHVEGKIGVVSLRKNLPFNYEQTLRKLALLRHRFIDDKYPLDSALFIDLPGLYGFHNLPTQPDEFCAGFLLFEPLRFATTMEGWFHEYDQSVVSITGGGDQTHMNFHIQSLDLANYLPYEFQGIWAFEAANYYGYLFMQKFNNLELYKDCVESTLQRVHFLHFAGNWPESSTFSKINFEFNPKFYDLYRAYESYTKMILSGSPKGVIKPNS